MIINKQKESIDDTLVMTEYVYDDSQSDANPRNGLSATSKYRVTTTGSVAPPSTIRYDGVCRSIRACTLGSNGSSTYQERRYNRFRSVGCITENDHAATGPTHWTQNIFKTRGRLDVVTARTTI